VSRPYTEEESVEALLSHIAALAHFWGTTEGRDGPKTPLERCNGLAFSILSMIDGSTLDLPAIDLSMSPHPDDRAYHVDNDENYWQPGVFNNEMLHERWHAIERKS
jgi:hypothetical protein